MASDRGRNGVKAVRVMPISEDELWANTAIIHDEPSQQPQQMILVHRLDFILSKIIATRDPHAAIAVMIVTGSGMLYIRIQHFLYTHS